MVSRIADNQEAGVALLGKLPDSTKVWMSHGDKLTIVPKVRLLGFCSTERRAQEICFFSGLGVLYGGVFGDVYV